MIFFTWDDGYSVGVKSIDEQHKKLIIYIDKLADAILRKRGETIVKIRTDDLIKFTVIHFDYEEGLLESSNYPFLEHHKAAHESLYDKLEGYIKEFNKGERSGENIILFLREWLEFHILCEDMEYSAHLTALNVK